MICDIIAMKCMPNYLIVIKAVHKVENNSSRKGSTLFCVLEQALQYNDTGSHNQKHQKEARLLPSDIGYKGNWPIKVEKFQNRNIMAGKTRQRK